MGGVGGEEGRGRGGGKVCGGGQLCMSDCLTRSQNSAASRFPFIQLVSCVTSQECHLSGNLESGAQCDNLILIRICCRVGHEGYNDDGLSR